MLFTRITQGIGAGFLGAIIMGFIIGFWKIIDNQLISIVILIAIYFPGGIISSINIKRPFFSAIITGFLLGVINQFLSSFVIQGNLNLNIPLLKGIFIGVIISLMGALMTYIIELAVKTRNNL
ncbi:hypothetical protein GCM10009001_00620 [Virgibacillus siamensis]|uniref:DUF1097 domain-containing protein n=1 Tax=Virgibacillus siamensis TaxID=480071 RepID=A0ABN1FE32_9BACI